MLVLHELEVTSNNETTSKMSAIITGSTVHQLHHSHTTRKHEAAKGMTTKYGEHLTGSQHQSVMTSPKATCLGAKEKEQTVKLIDLL